MVAVANMDIGALAKGVSLICLDFDTHTRRGRWSIHCNIQDSQVNQGREAGQAGHSKLSCTWETKVPQSAYGPEHAMVWDVRIQ